MADSYLQASAHSRPFLRESYWWGRGISIGRILNVGGGNFGAKRGKRSSAIAEGPRDASCQLKSCQMPCNSVETTYTTSPDQIDGMKLEI